MGPESVKNYLYITLFTFRQKAIMAMRAMFNAHRDTQNIPKLNVENHHELKHEVLAMAEQYDLMDLLIAPRGGVIATRPTPVRIIRGVEIVLDQYYSYNLMRLYTYNCKVTCCSRNSID